MYNILYVELNRKSENVNLEVRAMNKKVVGIFVGIVIVISSTVYGEALNIDFCDKLQQVLENQLLEGVDLGEFQFFLELFQPNDMDLNGKIYVDVMKIPIANVVGLSGT